MVPTMSTTEWHPRKIRSSFYFPCFTKNLFFSIRVFFHRHRRFTEHHRTAREGRVFHSSTSIRSRTFRHLFATLHFRWLSHIFNCTACIYLTATRWDLPPYRITIWLTVDDAVFVCLPDDLILGFCYSDLTREAGGFELASTITPVLQANRLTKCAGHPKKPSKD